MLDYVLAGYEARTCPFTIDQDLYYLGDRPGLDTTAGPSDNSGLTY